MYFKVSFFILFLWISTNLYPLPFDSNKKIESLFKKENIKGTIVINDHQKNRLIGYNLKRANILYSPASTFKIANSLIGLSTGTVKSVDDIFFKYQGQAAFLQEWKKDSSLKQAIKVSNVLAFQELARKIGRKKMAYHLKKIPYGNATIGSGIDTFWLDNSLKISAIQQVKFLDQLAHHQLPYSKSIQKDVSNIILLDGSHNLKIYGKTGWFVLDNDLNTIGWFVGWVQKNKDIYTFAMNMDIKKANKNDFPEQELLKRQKITMESLKILGIIDTQSV